MADQSIIAWTNSTANFWMGCEKVSPGCAHCYAETLTVNRMGLKVWGANSKRQEVKGIWANVRKWDAEARRRGVDHLVFVMSLGDFMEDHPDANDIRPRAYEAMRQTTNLTFQFLTKRPENYEKFLPADWLTHPVWKRVWLGTSIENDRHTFRADILRKVPVPSGVHWLSIEPLLGPLPSLDLTDIEWAIVGGESGPGFRPMDHAWARDIRDRCARHGIAFFMKQSAAYRTEMGTYLEEQDGTRWAYKQYPGKLDPPVEVR
jgi:protein gp37